jgi:hypothetical protein
MAKENPISTPENLVHLTSSTPKYRLDLLALPEYQEKDMGASTQLANDFSQITTIHNGLNCRLQVSDGYTNEDQSHYQLDVVWGDITTNLVKDFELRAPYFATTNGESFNGLIKVSVSLPKISTEFSPEALILHRVDLTEWAFKKYQELMEQFYPEWQTTYQKSDYQLLEKTSE